LCDLHAPSADRDLSVARWHFSAVRRCQGNESRIGQGKREMTVRTRPDHPSWKHIFLQMIKQGIEIVAHLGQEPAQSVAFV
jgi:hypothetical protein